MKNIERLGCFAQMRNALNSGGARADDANALITKLFKIAARGAARIVIIPAASVKGVTFKLRDTGYAR